ncbi:hypothetical protein Bca4012_055422 [Brassica carinata]
MMLNSMMRQLRVLFYDLTFFLNAEDRRLMTTIFSFQMHLIPVEISDMKTSAERDDSSKHIRRQKKTHL